MHDDVLAGEFGCDAGGGVLVFVAVAENEVVALRAVLAEIILKFGGGFCLDVTNAGTQAVSDLFQSFVGAGVVPYVPPISLVTTQNVASWPELNVVLAVPIPSPSVPVSTTRAMRELDGVPTPHEFAP